MLWSTCGRAVDKVYCEPAKVILPPDKPSSLSVQAVDQQNAAEWANFICATYGGLPNQPWLLALLNRKGWHHLLARKEGKIVACRTMYIDELNRAWLGIDAPIPGIMTAYYEPDYLICRQFLSIGQDNGVNLMTSCVEFIDETRSTDAYAYYYRLGFRVAYLKRNYGPV